MITCGTGAAPALERFLRLEGLGGQCLVEGSAGPEGFTLGVRTGESGSGAGIVFTGHTPLRAGVLLDQIRIHGDFANSQDIINISDVYTLDVVNYMLKDIRTGIDVRLTDKESGILSFLAKKQGVTVSRPELLQAVWQYAEGLETHTLETHIYRLRQKIERDPSKPVLLITDEKGYRLVHSGGL